MIQNGNIAKSISFVIVQYGIMIKSLVFTIVQYHSIAVRCIFCSYIYVCDHQIVNVIEINFSSSF